VFVLHRRILFLIVTVYRYRVARAWDAAKTFVTATRARLLYGQPVDGGGVVAV